MSLVIGKNHVNREQLALCVTPPAAKRFVPLPHVLLVEMTEKALKDAGFQILEEDFVTSTDGMELFGGFVIVRHDCEGPTRQLVCGVRNSNSGKFAAALVIGSRMMVCENLCFSSERKLSRRHTLNIMRDLPSILATTISGLVHEWCSMEQRINAYKSVDLSFEQACALTTTLVDNKSLTSQKYMDVINLWRDPSIAAEGMIFKSTFVTEEVDEYGVQKNHFDETAYLQAIEDKKSKLIAAFGKCGGLWGLYNAVTEALKGSNVSELANRTMKMQVTFDAVARYFPPVVGDALQDTEEGDEKAFREEFSPETDFEAETEELTDFTE